MKVMRSAGVEYLYTEPHKLFCPVCVETKNEERIRLSKKENELGDRLRMKYTMTGLFAAMLFKDSTHSLDCTGLSCKEPQDEILWEPRCDLCQSLLIVVEVLVDVGRWC